MSKKMLLPAAERSIIALDAGNFAHSTIYPNALATIGGNMFGGILVNAFAGQAASFATSVGYLGLSNIRFPGGELSENGSFLVTSGGDYKASVEGGDQAGWMGADQSHWNYAYDLGYPDLMNPALLARTDIMSFSDAVALANANGASVELVLPTVRYTDINNQLNASQESALLLRCHDDVANFLQNLYIAKSFGTPPAEAILDIGNENLIWTRSFDGETLAVGQKYDPVAVKRGVGLYISTARVMLDAAAEFRADHPDANFKMGLQVPYLNNQPGTDDPFHVLLAALKAMPASELAQIDLLRFHPLEHSFAYAVDLENWFSDDLSAYAGVINAARAEMGVAGSVEFAADAHTANGNDQGGASVITPAQSLQAAAATVAQFASLVEMGVTYASAWGVAINYSQDVQASYYDMATGLTHYTPRGEVLRQISETLSGTTLINSADYTDAGRVGPVNVQTFGDSSKYVIFVSANDIDDTRGRDVTINLGNLPHSIAYAWAESITTATGTGGEAVVWNPLTDAPGTEKGQTWLSFTDNSVTFHLGTDFEMVRLVVSIGDFGTANVDLMGDSRLGSGVIDDLLSAGSGKDVLQGLSGSDSLSGGAGDDKLYGDRATGMGPDMGDVLKGGAGNDMLYGGGGNDTLSGEQGADSLYGGDGDDLIYYDGKVDVVDGGAGYDTLILVSSADGIARPSGVSVIVTKGIEYVIGTQMADSFTGNAEANRMDGRGGDDFLASWAGDDVLDGQIGNDKIYAGDGQDMLFGSAGLDSLYGSTGNDTLVGGAGADRLYGGMGNDNFRFESMDQTGDTIMDFGDAAGNADRIVLDAAAFNLQLGRGTLSDQNFTVTIDSLTHQADDVFIFRSSDSTLWADTNGAAEGGLVMLAQFQALTADLQANDITLY